MRIGNVLRRIPTPVGQFGQAMLGLTIFEMVANMAGNRSVLEALAPKSLARTAVNAALWAYAPTMMGLIGLGQMAPWGLQWYGQALQTMQTLNWQRFHPAFSDNPYAIQQRQRMFGYLGNSLLGNEAAAFARRGY